MIVQRIPRQPSSRASARPIGPAPTIKTAVSVDAADAMASLEGRSVEIPALLAIPSKAAHQLNGFFCIASVPNGCDLSGPHFTRAEAAHFHTILKNGSKTKQIRARVRPGSEMELHRFPDRQPPIDPLFAHVARLVEVVGTTKFETKMFEVLREAINCDHLTAFAFSDHRPPRVLIAAN